jgi:hypothetical protein
MEIDDELKSNISSADTWLRLVLIVIFGFVTSLVAMPVVWVLAGVQFIFSLITGHPNDNLHRILHTFAAWLNQVFSYMLYVSDRKPFPLSDLPEFDDSGMHSDTSGAGQANRTQNVKETKEETS